MAKREIHCSHDKPISECIEHWPEFCEIVGDTIEVRALKWLLGDHTGTSSKTLCAFMLGVPGKQYQSPPSDADDRRRCIRLLKYIPEWLPLLPQLAAANPGAPHTVNGKTEHNHTWDYQIKLILQEGGF